MPELPEVETIRRMLQSSARGRTIAWVRLSGARLRSKVAGTLPRRLYGRTITDARRHGKYLLIELDGGLTLISHLGMSGRWQLGDDGPPPGLRHVHARIRFRDGTWLWFHDPRRFGLLRLVRSDRLAADPALSILGIDPVDSPPSGETLRAMARGTRVNVKNFLLDQRRIAGIGNIYASEILHRARVNPMRRAGTLGAPEWQGIAREIPAVLAEAIARMGTTLRMYRTLWNEPGSYGERLMVYARAGEPCYRCGTAIRRIVQGQRSTFYCPRCQGRRLGPNRPGWTCVHASAGPEKRPSAPRAASAERPDSQLRPRRPTHRL